MASKLEINKISSIELPNGITTHFIETNLQKKDIVTIIFSNGEHKTKITLPLETFNISILVKYAAASEHTIILHTDQFYLFAEQILPQLEILAYEAGKAEAGVAGVVGVARARHGKSSSHTASVASAKAVAIAAAAAATESEAQIIKRLQSELGSLVNMKIDDLPKTVIELEKAILLEYGKEAGRTSKSKSASAKSSAAKTKNDEDAGSKSKKATEMVEAPTGSATVAASDGSGGNSSSSSTAAAPLVLVAESFDYSSIPVDISDISRAVISLSELSGQELFGNVAGNMERILVEFNEDELDDDSQWVDAVRRIILLDYKKATNLGLRIIDMVTQFNTRTRASVNLEMSRNKKTGLPVFFLKNNACLHVTLSSSDVHFTCERLSEEDARRHIPFRLFYSDTDIAHGAAGSSSGSKMTIVPKFKNGSKYDLLSPSIVSDIYSSIFSAGAGSKATSIENCKFLDDATVLLECVLFIYKSCNRDRIVFTRRKGGYYEKYIKYKIKYLDLKNKLSK